MSRSEPRATSEMVVATLLWGGTFVALRDVLVSFDPDVLVLCRFGAAAAVFAAILAWRRRLPERDAIVGGAASGVFMAAGYLFQAIGLTSVSAGSSAFLTSTGTLFAGVFAWPLLGQRPTAVLALGLAIATLGSWLLAGRAGLELGVGEAWTLAGAFAYALQIVLVSRFAPRVDPVALAGVQALVVALLVAPLAAPELGTPHRARAGDLARIGYLIVAGSVAAPLL